MGSGVKWILAVLAILPLGALAQEELTLEDIWHSPKYSSEGVRGFQVLNDGESYVQIDYDKERNLQEINRYSIREGARLETIVSNAALIAGNGEQLNITYFKFSKDEKKLMFLTDIQFIYRHSYSAEFHVYDRETKSLYHSGKSVRYAEFSPDGSKVGYVFENNVYYYDLQSGKDVQVSFDGKENAVINGAVDWVYEEEFSMSRGYEWAPGSDYIAYYRFDESKVKEFSMDMYGTLYPAQERWKYPKAGEDNSVVKVKIFTVKSNSSITCNTGENTDIYLPRIQWTEEPGILAVQRLNRHQNHWEVLMYHVKDGQPKVVYEETNKAWIDVNDELHFSGTSFFFLSEKSGFNHIYRCEYTKNKVSAVTSGNWDVDQFYGYDPETKNVYFSAANESAVRRNLYSLNTEKSRGMQKLNDKAGWNSASFTKGFRYFLHTWSNATTPPVYTLRDAKGAEIRMLQDNFVLRETLKETKLGSFEFGTITTDSAVNLNYFMIKPADFDASKKYPVLFYVYGGPGSQTVKDSWGSSYYLWFNYLASKGYIVISVDNRGTGARGEAFKKKTYLQLGKYEIEDQIAAAKKIATLPYVDAGRIGIFGWSYGGYMASLGITKGADVFSCAVAVAPVTNWRYYDNIYTERYMRTPQENGDGYDTNSPINHVSKIKGDYLIVHGTADDNVHFQNTVEMIDAMIRANVRYDSEIYPNKNHGIGGGVTRLHLFRRISTFLTDNL